MPGAVASLRLSDAEIGDFVQVEGPAYSIWVWLRKGLAKFGKYTLSSMEMLHNLCQIRCRNMCKLALSCSLVKVEQRGDRRFCAS